MIMGSGVRTACFAHGFQRNNLLFLRSMCSSNSTQALSSFERAGILQRINAELDSDILSFCTL